MAISPDDLVTRIRKNSADALAAEQKTDLILEQRFDWRHSVTIDVGVYRDLPQPVMNDFLNKYRAAGWKVKYQTSFRNEAWYEFSVDLNNANDVRDSDSEYFKK